MDPRELPADYHASLLARCKNNPESIPLNNLHGYRNGHCSYCGQYQSFNWSLSKDEMKPYTYQLMAEKGWRRCGTYYYKPDLKKSCCKMYTHRLDATKFKPSKDQRKTVKKMIELCYKCVVTVDIAKSKKIHQQPKISKIVTEVDNKYITMMINVADIVSSILKKELPGLLGANILGEAEMAQFNWNVKEKIRCFASKPGESTDYYCNYVMLLYGCNKKLIKKLIKDPAYNLQKFVKSVKARVEEAGTCESYSVAVERGGYLLLKLSEKLKKENEGGFQVIQMIDEPSNQPRKVNEEKANLGITGFLHILTSKFTGESDKLKDLSLQQKQSSEYERLKEEYEGCITITSESITFGKLRVIIVQAEEDPDSFRLYQKYGKDIHEKKEKSMSSYVDFLCLRALNFEKEQMRGSNEHKLYIPSWDPLQKHQKGTPAEANPIKRMGCYHMKYYISQRLVGVGVVDMLPDGLSSVYFFYDSSYKPNRMGVFSSLMEIEYIRYMQLSFPEFRNYYMGFYINNNRKMDYKINYKPCSLLCPYTFRFEKLTDKLKEIVTLAQEGKGDVRLSPPDTSLSEDMQLGFDAGVYIDKKVRLSYKGKKINLKDINPSFFIPILTLLKEMVGVWGKDIFEVFEFTL